MGRELGELVLRLSGLRSCLLPSPPSSGWCLDRWPRGDPVLFMGTHMPWLNPYRTHLDNLSHYFTWGRWEVQSNSLPHSTLRIPCWKGVSLWILLLSLTLSPLNSLFLLYVGLPQTSIQTPPSLGISTPLHKVKGHATQCHLVACTLCHHRLWLDLSENCPLCRLLLAMKAYGCPHPISGENSRKLDSNLSSFYL